MRKSKDGVENFGSIAALILSAARNATEFMGGLKLVMDVFKNQKVLFINLQKYDLALALGLFRSADASYVCRKIVNTPGTSKLIVRRNRIRCTNLECGNR